ncbi:MAG: NACHT domain-containing protein [Oscillochloris sp.]|nr:NACHT domain-containing protein [Oscillochloris sp.]
MNQRHIILIILILPGAAGLLLDLAGWRVRILLDSLLGQNALLVLLFYVLLIGLLAGMEIGRSRLVGNSGSSYQPRERKPGNDRRPFERQYRETLYGSYRALVPTGIQNQQHKLDHSDIFEPPLLIINQSLSPPLPTTAAIAPAAPHDIWYHLAIPPRPRPTDLSRLFRPDRHQRHFVILGLPGVGKSSLLHHLVLTFVRKLHLDFKPPLRDLMPIMLVLREHKDKIKENPNVDISQLITSYSRTHLELARAEPAWFHSRLRHGSCIILLDGLDEVGDAHERQLVVDWVQSQIKRWPNNYIVVTSRPYGYINNQLHDVRVIEIESFNAVQIESFVGRWYKATEIKMTGRADDAVLRQARKQAEDLIARMTYKPAFSKLAANPLLLTMIATVHHYQLKLPEKRAGLYREIFEVFLGRRQKIDDGLVVLQKLRVLGPLAYQMMVRRDPQIGLADAIDVISPPLARVSQRTEPTIFLKRIEESSGLLLEVGPGVFKFAHLTYQEYLASVYLLDQHHEHELIDYVDDVWWHETILLAAAQEDASDVLEATLRYAGESEQALSLGVTLLDEAISLRPESRDAFLAYLEAHVDHGEPKQRALIAEALLRYNLQQMVMLDERKQRMISNMLVSQPAYQLFIESRRCQGIYVQPDHWQGYEFPNGGSKQPILGVRRQDAVAFCEWLTERDRDGMRFRLPTIEEGKSYRAGIDARLRYWVHDDPDAIYSDRWMMPHDQVRALLAHYLFRDLYAIQIFILGLLFEQMRLDVTDLSSYRNVMALSDEITAVKRIEEGGVVIGMIAHAISRSGPESLRDLIAELARVAQAIHDKAVLASERYTEAAAAARASSDARETARASAFARLTDDLRGTARETVRMISEILKQARSDLAHLRTTLTPSLREGMLSATKLQEAIQPTGIAGLRALAIPAQDAQTDMLADVREHIGLTEITRLADLARSGATCLDLAYASEPAALFTRSDGKLLAHAPEERAFLRYWVLANCLIWMSRSASDNAARAQGLRVCRRMYVDLVLLNERIAGRTHPVEGIRLVREQRSFDITS